MQRSWPGASRTISGLLFGRLLNSAEDCSNLTLQNRKIQIDHAAARVQNNIDRQTEHIKILAHGLSHSSLDAIAIDSLSHHLPHREAHARARSVCMAHRVSISTKLWP